VPKPKGAHYYYYYSYNYYYYTLFPFSLYTHTVCVLRTEASAIQSIRIRECHKSVGLPLRNEPRARR
jgi:hypothetical protein